MGSIECATTKLPFQSAKAAADLIAKQHHLSHYRVDVSLASEKGDNNSSCLYRVSITGMQAEKPVNLERNNENVNVNLIHHGQCPLSPKKRTLGKRSTHTSQENLSESNDIQFYNHDNFNDFPYKKGQNLELNLIFKVAPQSKARREQQNVKSYFEREVLIYTKLLSRFTELQKVNEIKNKIEFPRIYAYSLEDEEEFIVLEDLKASGHQMYNRHVTVDYNHANLVMKNIGKFHALSLVMKTKYSEEFLEYKSLSENIFVDPLPETYRMHWDSFFVKAIGTLDASEVELIKQMKDFQPQHADTFLQFTNGVNGEPYSCINHGDFWNNNMMYTYDTEGGPPSSVKFIDFQMCRYCPPMMDLMYFLFCCTDGDFRKDHYLTMLDIYYKSFCEFTEQLGCNPIFVMPYSQFQSEVKRYGIYGLCMAVICLIFFVTDDNDNLSVDELAEQVAKNEKEDLKLNISETTEMKYKKRMSEIIRDTSRFNYFKT